MLKPSGIERVAAEVHPSARSEAMANASGMPRRQRRRASDPGKRGRARDGDGDGDGHGGSPIRSSFLLLQFKWLSLKDRPLLEPPAHKLMQAAAAANDGFDPRDESRSS